MRPENAQRRILIRKWMSLPKTERQTRDQAARFAAKAIAADEVRCAGDRHRRVLTWLLPRTGR